MELARRCSPARRGHLPGRRVGRKSLAELRLLRAERHGPPVANGASLPGPTGCGRRRHADLLPPVQRLRQFRPERPVHALERRLSLAGGYATAPEIRCGSCCVTGFTTRSAWPIRRNGRPARRSRTRLPRDTTSGTRAWPRWPFWNGSISRTAPAGRSPPAGGPHGVGPGVPRRNAGRRCAFPAGWRTSEATITRCRRHPAEARGPGHRGPAVAIGRHGGSILVRGPKPSSQGGNAPRKPIVFPRLRSDGADGLGHAFLQEQIVRRAGGGLQETPRHGPAEQDVVQGQQRHPAVMGHDGPAGHGRGASRRDVGGVKSIAS